MKQKEFLETITSEWPKYESQYTELKERLDAEFDQEVVDYKIWQKMQKLSAFDLFKLANKGKRYLAKKWEELPEFE